MAAFLTNNLYVSTEKRFIFQKINVDMLKTGQRFISWSVLSIIVALFVRNNIFV